MKLPVIDIIEDSFVYAIKKIKNISVFALANFVLMFVGDLCGGWTHPIFFLFLILSYMLWVVFFRHYFKTEPYFDIGAAFHSLNPSIKIVLMMFFVGLIFVFLPYIFIALGIPFDYLEQYIDNSHFLTLILGLMFLFLAPIILYRPYFAWIGSVLDKNYSLKFAYSNTKGNYFRFLFILLFVGALLFFADLTQMPLWLEYLWVSFVFAYFNVILAKSYEFFFAKG